MDSIWDLVGFTLGMVVLLLVFQLLNLPEWISNHLKNRVPREELEKRVADLERRLEEVEQTAKEEP